MRLYRLAILAGVELALMLLVSAWAWFQLADDAQIAIHWGLSGSADSFAPKAIGLFMLPALVGFEAAILLLIPRFDPRRGHLELSSTAWVGIGGAALAFMGVIHLAIVASALGADIEMGRVATVSIGVLFAVIGNYLGKTRSNWFLGIRTPWTLSSERSWLLTHRLGSRLFIGLGLMGVVLGLVAGPDVGLVALMLSVLAVVALLFVYSYFAWRDDADRVQA
jgi:uncharacterized membrane protein